MERLFNQRSLCFRIVKKCGNSKTIFQSNNHNCFSKNFSKKCLPIKYELYTCFFFPIISRMQCTNAHGQQGCPLGWVTCVQICTNRQNAVQIRFYQLLAAPAAGLGLRPAFKSGNQLLPWAQGLISNLEFRRVYKYYHQYSPILHLQYKYLFYSKLPHISNYILSPV